MRTPLAAALAALLLAAPAASGAPDLGALAGDALDRAATLALPAVYRVETTVRLEGLVTAAGTGVDLPPGARTVRDVGTAFGVAPGGMVVTAAHLASPRGESLARAAYRRKLIEENRPQSEEIARDWVEANGARPSGVEVTRLVLIQADAGAGARDAVTFRPQVRRIDRAADLALLRIREARSAPALPLQTSATIGTPVATIGFGTGSAFTAPDRGHLEPAVRKGELGPSGEAKDDLPGEILTAVTTEIEDGDSGGPVVDADGHVRGVVIFSSADGGIMQRAAAVREVLQDAGIRPRAGETDRRFRDALARFWALDFAPAERGFARTSRAFASHTLAGALRERASSLRAAEFRLTAPRRTQAFLLALGVVSAIAALACGLALARPALARAFAPEP